MNTLIKVIQGDITKLKVDAIVNGANNTLSGGGILDAAIHRAAGPKLMEECRTLGGLKTGEAKITSGYDLPAKKVIHTVAPIWTGGKNNEDEEMASCFRNSLELAVKNHLKTIAFPPIGTGVYKFPRDRAFKIALDAIRKYTSFSDRLETIFLVAFDKETFDLYKEIF